MDWENDPELNDMREEFIDSLAGRLDALRTARQTSEPSPGVDIITHKLAGVAANYGFPILGQVCAALEDWMTSVAFDPGKLGPYAKLLERALQAAVAERADPSDLAQDPLLKELISAAGYPGGAPTSGSS